MLERAGERIDPVLLAIILPDSVHIQAGFVELGIAEKWKNWAGIFDRIVGPDSGRVSQTAVGGDHSLVGIYGAFQYMEFLQRKCQVEHWIGSFKASRATIGRFGQSAAVTMLSLDINLNIGILGQLALQSLREQERLAGSYGCRFNGRTNRFDDDAGFFDSATRSPRNRPTVARDGYLYWFSRIVAELPLLDDQRLGV